MLVNTKEQLSAVLEDLKKCKEIAFDLETTTLHHKTMEVLGISFCGDALLTSVYVDLSSTSDISKLDGWAAVNSIFKLDATFIAHNYVFDGKILHYFYKAYPEKVFDTMVAAWYLDENRESFGLKQLAKQILKLDMTKYKDVDKDDTEAFAKYGAMDAYATYELYKVFSGELAASPKANSLFLELEMQFLEVLIDITLSGFLMDQEYLVNMASSLRVNRDILKEKLEKDLGGININSTQQLCKALYGIEVSRKGGKLTMTKIDGGLVQPKLQTKSGAPATSDAALEKLDHPIIDRLREYRGVEKLLTTYAEGYQRFIVDGKIYPNFNPIGCVVGSTLIPTTKGVYPIEQLSNLGFQIINRCFDLETPCSFYKFENQEVISISLGLGIRFTGTRNHPVIVNEYNSKDRAANKESCKSRIYTSDRWKRLEDIEIGDYVKIPIGYRCFASKYVEINEQSIILKTNAKEVRFPRVLNEELAELLGIYFADGSIHDSNGSFSIRISNRDLEVQSRVDELSKKLFGIDATKSINDTSITSINLKDFFIKGLSIDRGAKNKIFPQSILRSPKSVVASFIKGITLDSSFIEEKTKRYLKISVSNPSAAETLQQVLFNFGIVSSVRRISDNYSVVCVYNQEYDKFIDEIGVVQSKKYGNTRCYSNRTSNNYLKSPDGKSIWVKVKGLVSGRNDVYDFTVPYTHSFISGCVVSHNTVTGRLACNDPNCFSGDTEVLTKNGWVRFDTLQKGVEVAQWDFGSVSFVQPKEYVEYTTDRPLIHIYNTHIDLLVTMDHRCLLQNRKTGKNRVVEAKNYMEDYRQLHSGWFVFGNTKLSKDFVVLLAATQADGYFTSSKKTDFVFSKKRKIERLLDSLSSLGIRPYVRAKGEATRITLGHKETLLIKEYLGNEKVFGPWVLDLDIETATLLSEEVYFWDGCYKRKTMYSSNIQQNVDWIQILHTLTNKRAKIREYQGIKNVNYQIDVTKNNYSLTTNIQKESVDGTSRVYCVSVPSSYLLVRRNGKTAVTGNCQNLPRAATDGWFIRDAFICPEGYDLIVADESQLELRLLAHFSKDPALMEAFLSEGDVHTRTASQIFRKPVDAITKEERQSSKTINFGIMYGMGPQKLADSLKITESQAKFLLQQYFETYEGVHEWFNTVETYAKRNGYVKTIIGRTRSLPDIWSRDRALYSRARRQAVNSVIQGSAADILKVAMVKIRQELKDRGLDATILSQIHDELVVQSLCSQSEEVAEVIKTYMEHPFSKELAVPLIVEPKIVKRWSDGK